MSGQQIGMVVGGAVGFFAGGNVALGMSIGGAIGGALDPPHYKAPGIGDPRPQTSQAGMPIPKFFGKPKPQPCTVIDGDPVARKILIETEQGKGGGPTVTSEGWIATRAFLVGEADEPLAGIGRIRRNGKLVYSTIAGDDLDADSAAFRSQLRIYLGGHTQLPDPSLEAIHGVGNTPYHRGKCYFVVVDDDETANGGMWNQYEVEPIASGTTASAAGTYDALGYGDMPWRANAPGSNDPRKPDLAYEYKFIDDGASYDPDATGWRATVAEAIDDAETATGYAAIGTPQLVGWSTRFYGFPPEGDLVSIAPWEDVDAVGQTEWRDRYVLGLHYTRYNADIQYQASVHAAGGPSTGTSACAYYAEPVFAIRVISNNGSATILNNLSTIQSASVGPAGNDLSKGCYAASYESAGLSVYSGFTIACRPKLSCGIDAYPATAIRSPDSSHVYVDTDGTVYTIDTCAEVAGTFKQLQKLSHDLDGGTLGTDVIERKPIGPVRVSGAADDTQANWEADYAVAVAAGDMVAGLTYPGNYPVSVTAACQCTPAVPLITPGSAILKDIIADTVGRTPCPVSNLNIDNLLDEVPGYAIDSADLSAADVIRDLLAIHFADIVEYDGKLNGIYRGGATVATIADSDILALDDEDDDTREQALEYNPLRVTLIYPDPANNYVDTPATSPRDTPDVVATGELVVQTSIPYDATTARRKAEILQKVVYARAEGGRKRALRAEYARLVASDAILIEGRREMIVKRDEDLGMVRIETKYDRASAYVSTTAGTTAPAPTPQTSNIKGPSIAVPMNLPPLRSSDDKPGIYVPVCGLRPEWPGADIYLSVDGGVTEQRMLRVLHQSVIGELAADCTSSGEPIVVQVYAGSSIASVTPDQIAARQNAFAIITGGVAEVGQTQTATEDAVIDRRYELTDNVRGGLGTTAAAHHAGDRFVMLDGDIPFLQIDSSHAGKTILVRAVTIGTVPASNDTVSLVFDPPTIVYTGGDSTT